MKKLMVLAAVAALFIVGCGKKADYYPLTVGNTWSYTTTSITTHTDTLLPGDTTVTTNGSEITAEVTLGNGDAGFEVVSTSDDTSYVAEKDDYVLGYSSLTDTVPDTLLANPLEDGKVWTVNSDSTTLYRIVILEKVSGITVPAGTYDDVWRTANIAVTGSTTDTIFYGWIAPNVGQIKSEFSMVIELPTDTMTMTSTTELQTVDIK